VDTAVGCNLGPSQTLYWHCACESVQSTRTDKQLVVKTGVLWVVGLSCLHCLLDFPSCGSAADDATSVQLLPAEAVYV